MNFSPFRLSLPAIIAVAAVAASCSSVDCPLNNKVLTKRVIGCPGDWVDIDADGNVSIDGETLDEPYLDPGSKGPGQCDISLPYQVPEDTYFVMGDKRSVSVDSRLTQVGCIPKDQIVGRLVLRVWPLGALGVVGS